MIPAIGLGQEPPGGDALKRPPRGHRGRLLDAPLILRSYLFLGLLEAFWAMFMLFLALHIGGWRYGSVLPPDSALYRGATGVTLVAVVFAQIGNLIGRRYETRSGLDSGLLRNRLLAIGITLELAFAWSALYWRPLSSALGTGPVASWLFCLAALGAPLLFFTDYARKRFATGKPQAGAVVVSPLPIR